MRDASQTEAANNLVVTDSKDEKFYCYIPDFFKKRLSPAFVPRAMEERPRRIDLEETSRSMRQDKTVGDMSSLKNPTSKIEVGLLKNKIELKPILVITSDVC
jgi:hypothetical protein